MRKNIIIAVMLIFVFVISMVGGIYFYKIFYLNESKNEKTDKIYSKEIAKEENTLNEAITTDSQEEKITPHTQLVLRKYYKECGHSINEYVEMPTELINMTKEELKEQYKDWSIYTFSEKEVILIKSVEEYCNQHYQLNELDGYIAIYKVGSNGTKTLQEKTSIAVRYLTPTDLSHLQNGIKIYGTENLNKYLEDFE